MTDISANVSFVVCSLGGNALVAIETLDTLVAIQRYKE
jgi:hypothetical protein